MGLVGRRQIGIVVWFGLFFLAIAWSSLRSSSTEATGIGFAPPIEISALETGRLVSLDVALHDEVKIDDVLARLDAGPLREQREVLAAQMRAVEQTVASDVASDTRRAVSTQMKRAQIQSDIREDEALIVALRQDKRIAEDLASSGAGSTNDVRDIDNQISIAQARLAGNRLASAGGLEAEDLDAPEENDWHVVAAARTLEMMDNRIDRMDILASIDGQITRIYHEPGEVVFGGDPVVQVTRTGTSEVLAYLPTPGAIGLDAGDAAWIVRSTGQVVRGALISVGSGPQALPEQLWHNPSYPEWGVPIRIKLAQGEIGPGEQVVVRI
jgi:multidrug resistance efflux pump